MSKKVRLSGNLQLPLIINPDSALENLRVTKVSGCTPDGMPIVWSYIFSTGISSHPGEQILTGLRAPKELNSAATVRRYHPFTRLPNHNQSMILIDPEEIGCL